jgi:hypothetical protein
VKFSVSVLLNSTILDDPTMPACPNLTETPAEPFQAQDFGLTSLFLPDNSRMRTFASELPKNIWRWRSRKHTLKVQETKSQKPARFGMKAGAC